MLAWREGGWVGIQDRRKEGECSDGRIKAVCCFHMVLCIYVYFLHVALIRQKRYVTVCRIFRNNCLLCVVGVLHLSLQQTPGGGAEFFPQSKQITPSLISPCVMPGVVNNSSRQPISLEDLCEYSLHHQPLM